MVVYARLARPLLCSERMRAVARALRPEPAGPWVLRQTLRDVLLAHWPVPPSALRPLVPFGLDTYAGHAWLTLQIAAIDNVRTRYLPRLPGLEMYNEVSLRTCVRHAGRAGVFYLERQVSHVLAAQLSRAASGASPRRADVSFGKSDETVYVSSKRAVTGEYPDEMAARYAPKEGVFTAAPGSLPEFLCERYYVYSDRKEPTRAEINHRPWPLENADAELSLNGFFPPGIVPGTSLPALHYCRELDVRVWAAERLLVAPAKRAERRDTELFGE